MVPNGFAITGSGDTFAYLPGWKANSLPENIENKSWKFITYQPAYYREILSL